MRKQTRSHNMNTNLAKRPLADRAVKVKVIEGDLGVEVDRLRETTADTSHLALPGGQSTKGSYEAVKYKGIGIRYASRSKLCSACAYMRANTGSVFFPLILVWSKLRLWP